MVRPIRRVGTKRGKMRRREFLRGVHMRAIVVGLVVLAAASSARAAGENMEQAKAYFKAGVDAYDQGKYEVALREFQHAHALSHSPALYFNMAACEEHMDHFQAAALLLRQYLIEKPDADDRDNVQLRITRAWRTGAARRRRDARRRRSTGSSRRRSRPTCSSA